MATVTVGYLKDYATPQLAEAGEVAGTDWVVYESDVYGNRRYGVNSWIPTKYGAWTAGVAGVVFSQMERPNPNSSSLLKFTGIGFIADGIWNISGVINLHFSRCNIYQHSNAMNVSASGNLLIENSIMISDSTATNLNILICNNASLTMRVYLSTLVSRGSAGDTSKIAQRANGTLKMANNKFITPGPNWATGAITADYNMVMVDSPVQTNAIVKTFDEMGLACGVAGYGVQGDVRTIKEDEVIGTLTFDGEDMTVYNKDIDGRTRTTWAVGCSEGFDTSATADLPDISNVINTDTLLGVTGTNRQALISNVLDTAPNYGPNDSLTGTASVAEPDAPSITAGTSTSDGEITLTLDVTNPTDIVYVRYRIAGTSGSWSAENPSFKRTGDGDITVTGLGLGTQYENIAYVNNGGCQSDWCDPYFVTADGGGTGANASVGDDMYVIVKRTIDGATRRYIELMSTRFTDNDVEPQNSYFVDSGLTYNGVPADEISGLGHLEGKEVAVLADGNVVYGLTVASGAITLPNEASVVHVGLPFTSTMETLDLELRTGSSPTIHNHERNVNGVTVKLKDTRALKIGPDATALEEQNFRTDEDPGDPTELFTGDIEIPLNPGNGKECVIMVQNTDPLPVNVLSIIAELEVGDV